MPILSRNTQSMLGTVDGKPNTRGRWTRKEVAPSTPPSEAYDHPPESSESEDALTRSSPLKAEQDVDRPRRSGKRKREDPGFRTPATLPKAEPEDGPPFKIPATLVKNPQKGLTYSRKYQTSVLRDSGAKAREKKKATADKRKNEEREPISEPALPAFKVPAGLISPPEFKAPPSVAGSSEGGSHSSGSRKTRGKGAKGPSKASRLSGAVLQIPEAAVVLKKLGITTSTNAASTENDTPTRSPRSSSPSDSESSLSSVPPDFDEADVSESIDPILEADGQEMIGTKRCPVCRTTILSAVFRLFLQTLPEHKRSQRLNTRHQVRFCRYHKDWAAQTDWRKRKYPIIDWGDLPGRVRKLKKQVELVIDEPENSQYSAQLLDSHKVDSGRRKRVVSEFGGDFGADRVGYYGGRGAKVIMEEVAKLCTSRLKSNESNEALAIAGSVGMYIEKVILPEVASRLVAQDMDCDLPAARDILVESADLGRQLNEELNDDVHEDEDETIDG